MNTTNNEEELKKIIARREGKMYGYYKATFDDDFTGGYPVEYDKELIDFCSSVRRETKRIEWLRFIDFLERNKKVAAIAQNLLYFNEMEQQLQISTNWYEKIYGEKPDLTNLDTISHEEN